LDLIQIGAQAGHELGQDDIRHHNGGGERHHAEQEATGSDPAFASIEQC
jgi:hypothetical protein